MGDGCYDLDGRCVNCKELHPCKCESEENLDLKKYDSHEEEA